MSHVEAARAAREGRPFPVGGATEPGGICGPPAAERTEMGLRKLEWRIINEGGDGWR